MLFTEMDVDKGLTKKPFPHDVIPDTYMGVSD